MSFSVTDLNPLTWISGLVGGLSSGSSTTGAAPVGGISFPVLLAGLELLSAFGIDPTKITPAQMAAISGFAAAMGYPVPALPVAAPVVAAVAQAAAAHA